MPEYIKPVYYTPKEMAADTGQSESTMRRYLRERFPNHEKRTLWRFDQCDRDAILEDLARPIKKELRHNGWKRCRNGRPDWRVESAQNPDQVPLFS